ncbi:ATP-binding protein [Candidatus Woesearchaeota archaeon]|nr:ATP-binding protein [Candidatus Woesearchaeota archaeon]
MASLSACRIEERSLVEGTAQAYGRLSQRYGLSLAKREGGAMLARFYALQDLVRPIVEEAFADVAPSLESNIAVDAYAFGLAALDTLTPERAELVGINGYRPTFKVSSASDSTRERLILGDMLLQYERKRGNDSDALLAAFYRAAQNSVAQLPAELRSRMEKQPIAIGEHIYAGLEESSSVSLRPTSQLEGGLEQVVGNTELVDEGRRILWNVLHYNVATRTNPLLASGSRIPVASLTYGPSGTGKTFTWERLLDEADETADRLDLAPVNRLYIDNSGKTEMANSGKKALEKIFAQTARRDQVHLILGDEIDTVVYGADQTQHNVEEGKIEGVFLAGISRWERERVGNLHGVFITNNYSRIADRIRNRLREAVFQALGPETPEEHAQLLIQELQGFDELDLLRIEDAALLGERSKECGNTGRDIKNIAVNIHRQYGGDPGFDSLRPLWESSIDPTRDPESFREERRRLGETVDDTCVLATMDAYAKSLAEDVAAAREERVQQGVEQHSVLLEIDNRVREE